MPSSPASDTRSMISRGGSCLKVMDTRPDLINLIPLYASSDALSLVIAHWRGSPAR